MVGHLTLLNTLLLPSSQQRILRLRLYDQDCPRAYGMAFHRDCLHMPDALHVSVQKMPCLVFYVIFNILFLLNVTVHLTSNFPTAILTVPASEDIINRIENLPSLLKYIPFYEVRKVMSYTHNSFFFDINAKHSIREPLERKYNRQ